ncbi:RHS repeat domain-containing protein [Aquimarina sp. MMG016]|uniref:RHS repeat domain-containing protein n=1 Tax=Aquimarina sp. MMG016 TaxID=2822690 RepID=UPI001B3A05B5|nr:RHS repeat domain-containing protein [Aquimarina sp. MMG016]MBQ4820849.1 RHS repeat protein [Aquimarina sp. MMG016]
MKHTYLQLILIISCFFAFQAELFAQDNSHDFQPYKLAESISSSPEVSGLGNYGSINGNKYNGTIDLSIPIYTIDFEGITLPIQLSYNSGGVRANQDASWVGLNWNLSSYIAINRTVNGSDDFRGEAPRRGFIYNNYNVQESQGADPYIEYEDIKDLHASFSNSPIIPIDMEPDLFELNLFGKAYKFRLKKKGTGNIIETVVFNNNNVIITFDFADKSFTIIDEKGFKYTFSTKEINTSFSTIPGGGNGATRPSNDSQALIHILADENRSNESVITSWLLDSIESPYGRTLNFEYQEGLHFTYPSYSEYMEVYDSTNKIFPNGGGITNSINYVHATTVVIENQYLKRISGDFGEIEFNLDTRLDLVTPIALSKMMNNTNFAIVTSLGTIRSHPAVPSTKVPLLLDNIKIKNIKNKEINHIDFVYSYFNNGQIDHTSKEKFIRLKLDSLLINDKKYTFEYEQQDELPIKSTKDVDFWGFYNNANNTQRIPSIGRFVTAAYLGGEIPGQAYVDYTLANRSADVNYGKIGTLNKITYPTGGYTQFEYEGHTALVEVTEPYKVTEYLADGRIRWTSLIDEKKYNFTYQYLKKAKDPTYKLLDQVEGGTNNTEFEEINIPSREFVVTEPTVFKASSKILCYHNCANIGFYYSDPIRSIVNVSTGETQTLFKCGDAGSTVTVQKNLSPGTYRVINNSLPFSPGDPGWPSTGVENEQNSVGAYKIYVRRNGSNNNIPQLFEPFEIGGLRVKSITNYSDQDVISGRKIYEYEHLNAFGTKETSGVLMDELIYFSKPYGFTSYDPRFWGGSPLKLDSESSLRKLPSAMGSHIGYSMVTEKNIDAFGKSNGFTKTKYINLPNQYHELSFCRRVYESGTIPGHYPEDVCIENTYVLGIAPKNSFGYINGKVSEEIIHNRSGDTLVHTKNKHKTLYGISGDRNFARVMPIYLFTPVFDFGRDHTTYYTFEFPRHYAFESVLEESITTKHLENLISNTELNVFNTATHHVSLSKFIGAENQEIETKYYYPYDTEVYNLPNMDKLRNTNRISTPIKKEIYRNNNLLSTQVIKFGNNLNTSNKTLRTAVETAKGIITTENPLETKVEFDKYDDHGNILQYKKKDGMVVTYVWGYNKTHPIAKIENASFTDVYTALGITENELKNYSEYNISRLDALRSHPDMVNVMITTFVYESLIGLKSMKDPRGYTSYYTYDEANRLKEVKDAEGNILSKNKYNYRSQH